MPRVQPFTVIAALPERLAPLRALANNLWWTWHYPAKSLFIRVSKDRYFKTRKNPVELINSLSRAEMEVLEKDKGFLAALAEVSDEFQTYLTSASWWSTQYPDLQDLKIAYFSAEFGLHESVPIYSGGLGVLAGDFLKASSDLGLPILGVGLLYYEGYFSQYLSADGWQKESYPQIELLKLPLRPALAADGNPAMVSVEIGQSIVHVKAWQVDVGRLQLYLLDTNIEENDEADRSITARLYGGDAHMRIKQELVLGIGGLRMLRTLKLNPDVCHLNEGHSAFLALEKIKELIGEKGLRFEEALVGARCTNLFTTHTPVPAGNDVFSHDLIEYYLTPYAKQLGVETETLLKLGRVQHEDVHEMFSTTVLALKTAARANAVSALHGQVSRRLWQNLWPNLPADQVPIRHVTNGVHSATWTSRDIAELYDRYLGPSWREHTSAPESWAAMADVPDEELWRILSRNRTAFITFCRERVRAQLIKRGAGRVEVENASRVLDPEILTIGFARRFASYKRATLIFQDIDRLISIIHNKQHPVQFVFAGKAHPADQPGKELIARIIHAARHPEFRDRLVFLEDYDMGVARNMLHGVDVWLNNPRRPLEASGTSGMKAAVNGALNLSVLDGWWCEAFNGENGWSIGQGEEYGDLHYQDELESRSIYDLLEREVLPTFYNRAEDGLPREWLSLVKQSIRTIGPAFSASRMASDYARDFYVDLGKSGRINAGRNYDNIRSRTATLARLQQHWPEIRILEVKTATVDHVAIGKPLPITLTAKLGPFAPDEIAAQVYYGALDATHHIHQSAVTELTLVSRREGDVYEFSGTLETDRAGSYGFSVRIVPLLEGRPAVTEPGLITWWN